MIWPVSAIFRHVNSGHPSERYSQITMDVRRAVADRLNAIESVHLRANAVKGMLKRTSGFPKAARSNPLCVISAGRGIRTLTGFPDAF